MSYKEKYAALSMQMDDLILGYLQESGKIETSGSVSRALCDPKTKPESFQFFTLTPMLAISLKDVKQVAHLKYNLNKYDKDGKLCEEKGNALRDMATGNRHLFIAYGENSCNDICSREVANKCLELRRDIMIGEHEMKNEEKREKSISKNLIRNSLEGMANRLLRSEVKRRKIKRFSGMTKKELINALVQEGAAVVNTENGFTFKTGDWSK